MSSIAPSVPSKNFTQNVRTHRQGDAPVKWRDSLLAVDDESGEIIGVLAHGVPLITNGNTNESTKLEYSAAHTYRDDDVRPPSRPSSVLHEDTFAPPPIPSKPLLHHITANDAAVLAADEKGSVDEEQDGKVKVMLAHVETHRPELLYDRDINLASDHFRDASGSTVGGPVLRLWKKAKGDKEKTKGRVAKDVMSVDANVSQEQAFQISEGSDSASAQKVIASTRQRSECSPESAERVALWDRFPTESVMTQHLPGHSVLVDFLSGSRISATIFDVTQPRSAKVTQASQERNDANQLAEIPDEVANSTQSRMLSYIPLLPDHLLSFFGLGYGKQKQPTETSTTESTSTSGAGDYLLTISKALSPSSLISGASTVWSGISSRGASLASWLGVTSSVLPLDETSSDRELEEEWECRMPTYDPNSLEGTPRPVYRRRKIVPSHKGLFSAQRSKADELTSPERRNRYSIVHSDQFGVMRKAFTNV